MLLAALDGLVVGRPELREDEHPFERPPYAVLVESRQRADHRAATNLVESMLTPMFLTGLHAPNPGMHALSWSWSGRTRSPL